MTCVRCNTTMLVQNAQTFTTTYSCPKPGCGNMCTVETPVKQAATWGTAAAAGATLLGLLFGGGGDGGDGGS